MDDYRARAELAERRVSEESAKVLALEKLVQNLMAESASLQRKWEQHRDGTRDSSRTSATTNPCTSTNPGTSTNTIPGIGDSSDALPAGRSRSGSAPPVETLPASSIGVLVVRLINLIAGSEASCRDTPVFLECWFDETAVRSHALPLGTGHGERSQGFTLPVRRPRINSTKSPEPLPLCIALCDADGDGGGRPVAIGVAHAHVADLQPFTPTLCAVNLVMPGSPMEYCLAAGHCGRRGAAAHGAWRAAWQRFTADTGSQSLDAKTSRDDAPVACAQLSLEWRPLASSLASSGPLASSGMVLFDALGFPMDGFDGRAPAAAAAPRLQKRPSYTSSMSALSGNFGTNLSFGGETVRSSLSPAQAAAIGRSSVGGWWEHDALHLCRWNAALCSCASLSDLPSSRLRYLLAGGVPLQHRLHVWEACAGASSLRSAYPGAQQRPGGQGPDSNGNHGSMAAEDGGNDPPDFVNAAKIIEMDLLRTFPTHPFFAQADAPPVAALRRLLHALARHNPAVSYCQGLNFVAAVLLLHGDEPGAFALLASLCDHLLPGFHDTTMEGLHVAQAALASVLQVTAPAVHQKLSAEGVPLKEQSTSWLLCVFIDALPLEATLRVWDLLFHDGQVALLRTTAAAFHLNGHSLLNAPSEIFDLRVVLEGCDPGEIVATSLDPIIQEAAADELAKAQQLHVQEASRVKYQGAERSGTRAGGRTG